MSALFVSTLVVAIAEIGDKTQLLSLLLAARFRRPVPIVLGILCATLANHAVAAWAGGWIAAQLGPVWLRWILGMSFLAIALWSLWPDRLDANTTVRGRFGVFLTTTCAFFVAEIGDKTQLATVALAARYDALVMVVLGSTLGMLLANAPVVWLGERIMRRISLRVVRWLAASGFAVLGIGVLLGIGA